MSLDYFKINQQNTKVLNVKIQNDVTTYLNFSLPLCAILWNENKVSWLYEHFTQVYCINKKKEFFWLDYMENLYFPKDTAEYFFMDSNSMESVTDIISFLKNMINECHYVILFVDSFYLPGKTQYLNTHAHIQVLFYGYDEMKKSFLSIGFDKQSIFTFFEDSYDDVSKAYFEGKNFYMKAPEWVRLYTAVLLKMEEPDKEYIFNPENFIESFKNYTLSTGESTMLRPEIRASRSENAVYGLKVNDELLFHLNNLLVGGYSMDYRFIHLLAEHKALLYRKLHYISNFVNRDNLREKTAEYKEIAEKFELVRRQYLKNVLIDNNFETFYGPLKNKVVIQKIIDAVSTLYKKESILLEEILGQLIKNKRIIK